MKYLISVIIVFFALMYAEVSVMPEAEVTVRISGFKNDKGICRLLVYADEKGFPEDPEYALIIQSGEIKDRKSEFSFMIPSGTYAISILHDENSNEKLDKTWYGKPREGFGISNNPRIRFSPPKFEEAAVSIEPGKSEVEITIIYL